MGIHFQDVSFAYYVPKKKKKPIFYTLKNVELKIEDTNEFIAIVGHTGSGKSTLVQLMNALHLPTKGIVQIDDLKIDAKPKFKLKKVRQKVGLVFQFPEYQIFEETVLKDIMFGPKNFGKTLEEAQQEAIRSSEVVGIETELLSRSPFSLSGGQMRKVAIAGILASDPDILVLDEPTVGLDPRAKKELLRFLKNLNETHHKTIIVITHDMDVVGKFAKRVVVMKDGEIAYDGKKEYLFALDDLKEKFNLDYPPVMKLMRHLQSKLGVKLNINQYFAYEAYQEIIKKMDEIKVGDQHE